MVPVSADYPTIFSPLRQGRKNAESIRFPESCGKNGACANTASKREKQLPTLLCRQTGAEMLYPVHRLDKETPGVMVFAKTKSAAAYFSKEIGENRFQKQYLAVVKGRLEEKTATLTDLLFRDKQKNKSHPVKRMRKGVKEAVLSYRVLEEITVENRLYSLVEAFPPF